MDEFYMEGRKKDQLKATDERSQRLDEAIAITTVENVQFLRKFFGKYMKNVNFEKDRNLSDLTKKAKRQSSENNRYFASTH